MNSLDVARDLRAGRIHLTEDNGMDYELFDLGTELIWANLGLRLASRPKTDAERAWRFCMGMD